MFWAFFVATPLLVAFVAGLVALAVVGAGLRSYGAARVATDPDGFSAGRALLPYRYVGEVEALDAAATRRLLGVDADARAYLLVRAYCRGAVKVMVADPADPAPYWLVSTRHPGLLAASLGAPCRARLRTTSRRPADASRRRGSKRGQACRRKDKGRAEGPTPRPRRWLTSERTRATPDLEAAQHRRPPSWPGC